MLREITTARGCPWCTAARARRIWSEAGYHYVRCSSCGGVFSDLTEAEYESVRQNAWDEEILSDAAVAFYGDARERPHDEFLERYRPTGNGRLLDVGCGLGFFLARAQQSGWDVHGIDTSAAWVDLANARLGGNRVELATVERASLAPGSFELITAWDVIEHIFDPIAFLAQLRELIAPGGRLFIRTPNITYGYPVYGLRRRLLGHEVELGPTNHVVYFTARTMRDALRRAGLRAREWPTHVPPQVAPVASGTAASRRRTDGIIATKNAYARFAGSLSRLTGGRVVLSSDLDVMCVVADPVTARRPRRS